MPPSALERYTDWISHAPETWNRNDLDRFYLFVRVLLMNAKKERSRWWLEKNLRMDCPKLSEELISAYGEAYEHIKDYRTVFRRQLAKLLAEEERRKHYEKIKAQLDREF